MRSKPLAAATAVLLAGCISSPATGALPFFAQVAPQPAGHEEVRLTAALDGQLVVEEGCVKLRSSRTQQTTTVLWYQGVELDRDEAGLFLRSAHDGQVTRFSVPARFGGGAASTSYVQRAYPRVARRCGPPYAYASLPSD